MNAEPHLPRFFVLGALILCLAACAAAPKPNPFRPETALFARGHRLLHAGDKAGAERAFQAAVRENPLFVEAHRELQNLLEARYLRHEVIGKYDGVLGAYPREGGLHYLRGRVAGEAEEQLRYFRRACELDPKSFWGHYGRGYVLHKMGDNDGARDAMERAVELNPDSALPHIVLGVLSAKKHDFDRAKRYWSRAALLDPENSRPVYLAANTLYMEGRLNAALSLGLAALPRLTTSEGLFELLRKILRRADDPQAFERVYRKTTLLLRVKSTSMLEALAGYAAHHRGHLPKARVHYQRAVKAGFNPMLFVNDQRLLLVRQGSYKEAWKVWKAKLPLARVFTPANEVLPRLTALEKALHGVKTPPDAPSLLALGRALREAGWVREALEVVKRAQLLKDNEAVVKERLALENHLRFTRFLVDLFSSGYREFFKSKRKPDLQAYLRRIGTVSRSLLDTDLGEGNALRDFSFIGRIVDPSKPDQSRLAAYFRRFNQYIIVGQRNQKIPEATLMTMAYLHKDEKIAFPGEDLTAEVVFGDDFQLRSLSEFGGGDVLGAALFHGFYLNLDTLAEKEFRHWRDFLKIANDPGDLVNYSSFETQAGEDLLAVDDGRGLDQLLMLRAYSERLGDPEKALLVLDKLTPSKLPQSFRLFFQGAYFHEAMHVVDARRYLPVGSHPIAALGLAIRHGFSQSEIAAVMEENAGLAALALSDAPLAELASIVPFMPYPHGQKPHSLGYYNLLKALLRRAVRSQGTDDPVQNLDFEQNLFRQLHKIPGERLRRMARSVARERGLFHVKESAQPKKGGAK